VLGTSEPIEVDSDAAALWITRFDWEDEADLTALVTRAIKVGVTDLLMQVRGAGDALYRSEVAPASAKIAGRLGWAPKWDPLEVVCDLAAPHDGVLVHAWVNALSGWPAGSLEVCGGLEPSQPGYPDHLLVRHPDAVLVDASGKPMPCPNDTDYVWVSARHVDVVRELQAATTRADGAVPADRHPSRSHPLPTADGSTRSTQAPARGITDLVAAVRKRVRTASRCRRRLMPDYTTVTDGSPKPHRHVRARRLGMGQTGPLHDGDPMVYRRSAGRDLGLGDADRAHLDACRTEPAGVALYAEHEPDMLRREAELFVDRPIAGVPGTGAADPGERRWEVVREVIARSR